MRKVNQAKSSRKIAESEALFFANINGKECLFVKAKWESQAKAYALQNRTLAKIKNEFAEKV
jgi:hypothetical protein